MLLKVSRPSPYSPSEENLARIDQLLLGSRTSDALTCQGVHVTRNKEDLVQLIPEAGRLSPIQLKRSEPNFRYAECIDVSVVKSGFTSDQRYTLKPLGEQNWPKVAESLRGGDHPALNWPFAAKIAVPALFLEDTLVAAPMMHYISNQEGPNIDLHFGCLETRLMQCFEGEQHVR